MRTNLRALLVAGTVLLASLGSGVASTAFADAPSPATADRSAKKSDDWHFVGYFGNEVLCTISMLSYKAGGYRTNPNSTPCYQDFWGYYFEYIREG